MVANWLAILAECCGLLISRLGMASPIPFTQTNVINFSFHRAEPIEICSCGEENNKESD
jgi:hypothetical protein